MTLIATSFSNPCGMPQLSRSERFALVRYVEDFIKRFNPRLNHYVDSELAATITDVEKQKDEVKVVLDKILSFDLIKSKSPYIYQLEVIYAENKYSHINELLKVLGNRKGVAIALRGERTRGNYRFTILLDVARGGDLTDGIARVAKLVYFLNTI